MAKRKTADKEEKVIIDYKYEDMLPKKSTYDYSTLGEWVYIESLVDTKHLRKGNKYRVGQSTAILLHKSELVKFI